MRSECIESTELINKEFVSYIYFLNSYYFLWLDYSNQFCNLTQIKIKVWKPLLIF